MYPLVSIVIPSYNHENYIEETITSVMEQTYKNIELVVIDDGSTDNSDEVIKNCLARYKNGFKYIRKENEGLIKTLNYGLSLINGQYYQALASDDIIYKDKIEKQVRFLEENQDHSMVFSDCHRFYENTKLKIKASKDYKFKGGYIFKEIFTSYFSIPALTVLIRSNIIKEYGYLENFKVEDWVLWNRIGFSHKIGYIDFPLALYRIHDENMHKNFELTKMEKIKVLNYIRDEFSIEDNIFEIANNNSTYKQARNYNRGIIYCKKQFVLGLIRKLQKKMTMNISSKDTIKFIFRWW
jgi:alpha-1,3-rhamnosyltransferase